MSLLERINAQLVSTSEEQHRLACQAAALRRARTLLHVGVPEAEVISSLERELLRQAGREQAVAREESAA